MAAAEEDDGLRDSVEEDYESSDETEDEGYDGICIVTGHGGYVRTSSGIQEGVMDIGQVYVINAITPGCCLSATQEEDDTFVSQLKEQVRDSPKTVKSLREILKRINMFKTKCMPKRYLSKITKLKEYPARYLKSTFLDTFLDKEYSSDKDIKHACFFINLEGDITEITDKEQHHLKSNYLRHIETTTHSSRIMWIDITCSEGDMGEPQIRNACIIGHSCGGKLKKNKKTKNKKTKKQKTKTKKQKFIR